MKYIGKKPAVTPEDALELMKKMESIWEKNDGITWGIFNKDTNEMIGTTGFHRIEKENHRAEVGYMLKSSEFGKQVMTEIMPVMIDFAFNVMQVHTIEANVNPENEGSMRLLEKFNFVKEGHLRESFLFDGKFSDTVIYSLLNTSHAVPAV